MSETAIGSRNAQGHATPQAADETGLPAINHTGLTRPVVPEILIETQGAVARAVVIDIDRLYEAPPGTASPMVTVLELLKQVCDFLAEAQKSAAPMEADRFVQRAQLALPKLFAHRSIGDGFGVIINSLHFAFVNLHGTPLRPDQINVMSRILRELRARPVMSLEQGIQRVEELEARGLEVDPPDLGDLLDAAESAENE